MRTKRSNSRVIGQHSKKNKLVENQVGVVSVVPPVGAVNMQVSLNAVGKNHIQELLSLMRNAGIENPETPPNALPASLPSATSTPTTAPDPASASTMRGDIEKYRSIVDGPDSNDMGDIDDMDFEHSMLSKDFPDFKDSTSMDSDFDMDPSIDFDSSPISKSKKRDTDTFEDRGAGYANEPDEQYLDHGSMLNDMSGGINRKKKMYKATQDGDNPMSVESIKHRLHELLSEKMSSCKPKKKSKKTAEVPESLLSSKGNLLEFDSLVELYQNGTISYKEFKESFDQLNSSDEFDDLDNDDFSTNKPLTDRELDMLTPDESFFADLDDELSQDRGPYKESKKPKAKVNDEKFPPKFGKKTSSKDKGSSDKKPVPDFITASKKKKKQ